MPRQVRSIPFQLFVGWVEIIFNFSKLWDGISRTLGGFRYRHNSNVPLWGNYEISGLRLNVGFNKLIIRLLISFRSSTFMKNFFNFILCVLYFLVEDQFNTLATIESGASLPRHQSNAPADLGSTIRSGQILIPLILPVVPDDLKTWRTYLVDQAAEWSCWWQSRQKNPFKSFSKQSQDISKMIHCSCTPRWDYKVYQYCSR